MEIDEENLLSIFFELITDSIGVLPHPFARPAKRLCSFLIFYCVSSSNTPLLIREPTCIFHAARRLAEEVSHSSKRSSPPAYIKCRSGDSASEVSVHTLTPGCRRCCSQTELQRSLVYTVCEVYWLIKAKCAACFPLLLIELRVKIKKWDWCWCLSGHSLDIGIEEWPWKLTDLKLHKNSFIDSCY